MLILTLPMVKHLVAQDKLASGENRSLTQKPALPKNYSQYKSFIKNVDNYLSDQFGFRKTFISTANKIQYFLFNQVTSKQITFGSSGFVFLNSHLSRFPNSLIKSICGISKVPRDFKNKLHQNIVSFIDRTTQFDIETSLAILPSKSRIYPEKLPKPLKSRCTLNFPTWRDNLFEEIAKTKSLYYPIKKMLDLKASVQVYLPTFFHWHGELPSILAEDMMSTLWQISPEFKYVAKPIKVQSDLRMHLKGLRFEDDSIEYVDENNRLSECHGKFCIPDFIHYYKSGDSHTYINKKAHNNRTLIVLSDSFGPIIAKEFLRGFQKVICINVYNLTQAEKAPFYQWIIEDIHPTHLLYLIHDGGTFGMASMLEDLIEDV